MVLYQQVIRVISLFLFFFLFAVRGVVANAGLAHHEDRFFDIVAIDTMKFSRDGARNKQVTALIPTLVASTASLSPTHIALGTPYNDEFLPLMRTWIGESRKHKMNIWFRGNFAQWEDWFNYGRMSNPGDHVELTYNYIIANPDLFEDGDIFTPVPEPENGGFGDPRFGDEIKQKFFAFLPNSYRRCQDAFRVINKKVACGLYSVNGDVAKLFTRDDVQKIGNLLVIDHYVKTPEQLINDAKKLHETTGADIILGEYGAPIPDIHGELSQQEQADLIEKNFQAIVANRSYIRGINYWTAFGGSTQIFDDPKTPRLAARVVKSYYKPTIVVGKITDNFGVPLNNVKVTITNISSDTTDSTGHFRLLTLPGELQIKVEKTGYRPRTVTAAIGLDNEAHINLKLSPKHKGMLYYLSLFFSNLTSLFR